MGTEATQQDPSLSDDIAANLAHDEELEVEAAGEDVAEEVTEEETIEEVLEALEPPPKWDARYKEAFQAWGNHENGRDIQQTVLDLYKEQQGYATKIEQDRAQARREAEQYQQFANQWNQVLTPYQDLLRQTGATPDQAVRQSLGLLHALKQDPQAAIMRLAREANVDLRQALEGQEWESPESKQISELKRQYGQLQQQMMQREQRQAQMQMQQIQAENAQQIQAFADAVDDNGSPAHPHLNDVQETMAELIYGRENLRRQNPQLPSMGLAEAYERACKIHPEISSATSKSAEADRLAKANAEAKKAKDAAKRVAPGTAGKSPSKKSLRQEIEDNIRNQAA